MNAHSNYARSTSLIKTDHPWTCRKSERSFFGESKRWVENNDLREDIKQKMFSLANSEVWEIRLKSGRYDRISKCT